MFSSSPVPVETPKATAGARSFLLFLDHVHVYACVRVVFAIFAFSDYCHSSFVVALWRCKTFQICLLPAYAW
jgi:hypothetical protein